MGNGILELLQAFISSGLFDTITAMFIGLALLVFLFGLAKYIIRTDEVEGKEAAKNIMIWGVITIFLMVSIWGLVSFLQTLTGASNPVVPLDVPELPEV